MSQWPKSLKPVAKYMARAREVERSDPLVSFYCNSYSLKRCIELRDHSDESANRFIKQLLEKCDRAKHEIGDDDGSHKERVERLALNVFYTADDQDRAGNANKETATAFFAAMCFLEVCSVFGTLDENLNEKLRYSRFKASDILKALKAGRKPTPGNGSEQVQVQEQEQELETRIKEEDIDFPKHVDAQDRSLGAGAGVGPAPVEREYDSDVHTYQPQANKFAYPSPASPASNTKFPRYHTPLSPHPHSPPILPHIPPSSKRMPQIYPDPTQYAQHKHEEQQQSNLPEQFTNSLSLQQDYLPPSMEAQPQNMDPPPSMETQPPNMYSPPSMETQPPNMYSPLSMETQPQNIYSSPGVETQQTQQLPNIYPPPVIKAQQTQLLQNRCSPPPQEQSQNRYSPPPHQLQPEEMIAYKPKSRIPKQNPEIKDILDAQRHTKNALSAFDFRDITTAMNSLQKALDLISRT